MNNKSLLLGQVLKAINSFPRGHHLYLPSASSFWADDAHCMVSNTLNISVLPFINKYKLRDTLSVDQTQGVVENAQLQKLKPSISYLVYAFNYYFRHDAYIDFGLIGF